MGGGTGWENALTCTSTTCKTESWWKAAEGNREPNRGCNDLGVGVWLVKGGREVHKDIPTGLKPLYCRNEHNTAEQLYSNTK